MRVAGLSVTTPATGPAGPVTVTLVVLTVDARRASEKSTTIFVNRSVPTVVSCGTRLPVATVGAVWSTLTQVTFALVTLAATMVPVPVVTEQVCAGAVGCVNTVTA